MTDQTHELTADPDEVIAYLWELSGIFSRSEEAERFEPPTPPPALEFQLNGGASPMVARYYGDVLTALRPLPKNAKVLDVGCGYGRIALELTNRLTPEQQYFGLDPNREAVTWAQQNIAAHKPNFSFDHIDIASLPYNPEGTLAGSGFRFPFDDGSLDLIFMISVMTHVDLQTVETYVREAARTLNPETGRFVATFFLLDEEVDGLLARGASTFEMKWPHGASRVENPENPELAIAHPRELVLSLVRAAGFETIEVSDGFWSGRTGTAPMDYQDLVIADLSATPPAQDAAAENAPGEHDYRLASDIEATLAAAGLTTRQQVADFLTWAVPAVFNTLWWQTGRLELVTSDGAPLDLQFEYCRRLGLRAKATSTSLAGRFVPIDDAHTMSLIHAAGQQATRANVLGAINEVAKNGLNMLTELRSGGELMLRSADGSLRPAPLPSVESLGFA